MNGEVGTRNAGLYAWNQRKVFKKFSINGRNFLVIFRWNSHQKGNFNDSEGPVQTRRELTSKVKYLRIALSAMKGHELDWACQRARARRLVSDGSSVIVRASSSSVSEPAESESESNSTSNISWMKSI